MKFITVIFALFLSNGISAAVGDDVSTASEVIGEIRVDSKGTVYFTPVDGNWSSSGCPSAVYAYFTPAYEAADMTYSAALASKTSKTPIKFRGVCGDTNGNAQYIQITYMTF